MGVDSANQHAATIAQYISVIAEDFSDCVSDRFSLWFSGDSRLSVCSTGEAGWRLAMREHTLETGMKGACLFGALSWSGVYSPR